MSNAAAIAVIVSAVCLVLAAVIVTLVVYIQQRRKVTEALQEVTRLTDERDAAQRAVESLRVQVKAKEAALEAAKKTITELVGDAEKNYPPSGGSLAGPPIEVEG